SVTRCNKTRTQPDMPMKARFLGGLPGAAMLKRRRGESWQNEAIDAHNRMMRFVPRKPLPHQVPPWVKNASLYFFTLCARPVGTDDLVRPDTAKAVLSAAEHYHLSGRWHMRILLLMPDHLHALAAFPGNA